ncbi:MAG TPA: M48 family metalloprotease, partial [Thermoanaerobaculia bacterium]|nr:M48 family metalloprotease [Thermoanaerobaculia bacterium]
MKFLARSVSAALAVGLLAQPLPLASQESPPAQAPVRDNLYEKSLKAAVEALKVYGVWDAPAEQARLNELGYRVAQESGFREYPISFSLIDMPEPNAFALPGGQIFVTRGMLSLGLTDDELAALLGHEIAHVVHEHGTRIQRRATLLNVLTQALVLGLALSADRRPDPVPGDPYGYGRGGGDLVTGSYAAGMIVSELLLRSYSREFEDEADEDGQRWAAAAGFAPDGTGRLMKVLGSRLPESGDYGYWRTHPFFAQRVTAAEARGRGLARGDEKPAAEFRSWSQRRLLDLGAGQSAESPEGLFVASTALATWPRGAEAERLRLDRIHRARASTLEAIPLSRDYGALLRTYDREIEDVATLDPDSSLLGKLGTEREALAAEARELLPEA